MAAVIWTAGHSNVDVEVLIDVLRDAGTEVLFDVRRFPMSRRHPHFNRDALAESLHLAGIQYRHLEALGGRRAPEGDSVNGGLRDVGFRGYADYMATPQFDAALAVVLEAAESGRVVIMCAEALPWRCHRSLISDVLVARGHEVRHLLGGRERDHTLSPYARVADGKVSYPALL